jgi:DNA (cytosine-5)-methyltransferase 1
MKIVSFFTGAGGLDLGFHNAWFSTVWANEYDKTIWETFEKNFPTTYLDKRSIVDIPSSDVPDCIWIIGWPPCQSWSEAWAGRWIQDKRGQLFYEYIRILKEKQPLFFLAENVSGILLPKHKEAFKSIIAEFRAIWYAVSFNLLNANNYWVPQDRLRVIIVGYHEKMGKDFTVPEENKYKPVLRDAIFDLRNAKAAKEKNYANDPSELFTRNHEYMTGSYSTIFMSRNRVRSWDEPSFTIQAWWRHAPLHPKAPKMKFIEANKRIFVPWKEDLYRRLTVRECARIQTFPDEFIFYYKNIADWYKMIGNAVPVIFAQRIAEQIYKDLLGHFLKKKEDLNTSILLKEKIFGYELVR